MRKRFFKISIGLLVTFIMSIMPVNIQYIFAAENEMLVDDTVTTGVHYFTYTEETDTSGKNGWASDKKSSIKGEEYAQTQHWVWNNDSKEAAKHTYTFTFEGTGVELWGVKSDDYNMFQLDNGQIEKVKIEGEADTPTKLYSKTGLTKGRHTVKVTLAENGKGLQVSYAKVIGASQDNPDNQIEKIIPTKVEGTTNKFTYNNPNGFKWSFSSSEAYIDTKGDVSKAEECYYEIPFYGNGIEIFANKNHNHGIVKFTIDGKYDKEVDLYNSTRTQAQSVYKISGLEEGNHTLKAVMQTKKNSGSSNYVNQVAYAEVSHAPYVIKDIILAEKSYEMSEGATQKIEYTLTPEYVTVNDIVFESQNKDIATVNSKGVITAVKEGTAKITVSSEKANIKKEITVNVKKAVPGIGGSIVDVNTQYTQDRYEEVKKLGTTSATLTAWKNDKAISEISLYSKDSKLSNVSISVSDFKNGEKVLKSDNIKATIKVTVSPVTIDKSAQVSYYSFDKDKDGKVVDEWGSRNGINEGTIAKGKSNNALKVTEDGKSVTLEGDSQIAADDAWSIAYWVNTDAEFNKEISVISDKDKAFAASLKMAENRDSGFRVGKGNGDVLTFQYDFKPDNWYHIAWTQSKTDGLSMYINGQLIQKNDWTKKNTVKFPMDIIGSTGFTGLIDEVKVYNKVLNPSEIASTMLVKGLNITENYKRLYIGETYTVETNLLSDNEDKTITYKSSNPNIASVDENGVVTAKERGLTTITVENKAGGYKEEVTIEVSKKLTISNTLETYELPVNRLTDIERSPGGDRQYLGQPDMVRTSTGRLITAYPKGHGKGPIIMQISDDNGETWTENNNIPSSWIGSQETPTLYVLPLGNGKERIMMITACPGWGTDSNGNKTGWNTSYSDDNGETWTEYKHWYSNHENGKENNVIVGMASLVQLKDESGNYIQKWMGVYHDYDYVNYKTYLTFNENGEEQWSEPEPYLSDYRNIESTYKMCEIGMFRSPDGKRIVGLARSQSHNNPATMIYSDDEGNSWSKPMDLPGSLAGERHKAAYDPISGRLVISFREIQYDLNGNNTFDGDADWTAGEWVAWVGTYEDLMEQRDGQYRIEICKDYSKSAKSGDTGYAGVVVLDDGTFIMDSYGHWDEEFSNNWTGGVTTDLCYIKQAKFKLSEIDNMAGLIDRSELEELIDKVSGLNKYEYTPESWSDFEIALNKAINVKDNVESTQDEIDEAKEKLSKSFDNLKKNKTDTGGSEDTSDNDVDDSNSVKTGDTTNTAMLYLVALMSLSVMFIFKRKRRSI